MLPGCKYCRHNYRNTTGVEFSVDSVQDAEMVRRFSYDAEVVRRARAPVVAVCGPPGESGRDRGRLPDAAAAD